MARLRNTLRVEEARLVGALLPQRLNNYLITYALAKRITKTKIVRGLLEEWMERSRQTDPDEMLIIQIAEYYTRQWNILKIDHPEADFKEYKSDVQRTLLNKDLPDTYVQLVLLKIKK